ncbi:MAG: tRNA pseudouridine(13) synthase TruD [Kangiellaceae bacterium]|nr:tRNA pseudouridine(13) synthase TruD [Kangiellaceae bacterium]MCW9017917.1 tRNA pseudouridine(13) synthase TruD [Kangiellaceae bacterium]
MIQDYLEYQTHFERLPTAHNFERINAVIREVDDDFQVREVLSFEPSGQGEHLFLHLEKRGCNTEWLARQLQKAFGIRSKDIGYAGKKDKASLSRQWFSLHLPGKNLSQQEIENQLGINGVKLIEWCRHNKKLRRGAVKRNQFRIRLREVGGNISEEAISKLTEQGFPNYFGYQRFGLKASNLVKAEKLMVDNLRVKSRDKRGLYLSAARSYIFNLILAQRVSSKTWNKPVEGDCYILNGTNSVFSESLSSEIKARLKSGDIHIAGWLAGRQKSRTTEQALQVESQVMLNFEDWIDGLAKHRVDSAQRSFRVFPENLAMRLFDNNQDEIELSFDLPSGVFATGLLRELFYIRDRAVERTIQVMNESD